MYNIYVYIYIYIYTYTYIHYGLTFLHHVFILVCMLVKSAACFVLKRNVFTCVFEDSAPQRDLENMLGRLIEKESSVLKDSKYSTY